MNATSLTASRAGALILALAAGIVLGASGVRWFLGSASDVAGVATDDRDVLPSGTVSVPLTAQQSAGVELVTAATTRVSGTLDLTGLVTADESRVAHMRPLARGVVERIDVALGSRVTAGQPLLTYDNIELGQLVGEYLMEQSSLRQARTDREVRRTALGRAETLITIEAIARQELDLRRAEFANAEAAVASAEARVSRVEEQLHRFGLSDEDLVALRPTGDPAPHRAASHSILRAPFAGVITRFDVAVGEVVESDKEVFTVADLSTVWVLADVYEKDVAGVAREGTVTVTTDAYPGRVFEGRITHVSDIIDPATRTAKVRCVVDNRDGALKLDMFTRVTMGTGETRESVTVPAEAVQLVDNQPVVFVVDSATRFSRRDVVLGQRTGNRVEILDGIGEGTRLVGAGSFYLKTALLRERIGDEH